MNVNQRRLQLAMARACMNVGELSMASNVARATITRILCHQNTARYSTVGKLAKALGVDVTELTEKGGDFYEEQA
jgi:transcriptional regulator with XRE-family HTH domain